MGDRKRVRHILSEALEQRVIEAYSLGVEGAVEDMADIIGEAESSGYITGYERGYADAKDGKPSQFEDDQERGDGADG